MLCSYCGEEYGEHHWCVPKFVIYGMEEYPDGYQYTGVVDFDFFTYKDKTDYKVIKRVGRNVYVEISTESSKYTHDPRMEN